MKIEMKIDKEKVWLDFKRLLSILWIMLYFIIITSSVENAIHNTPVKSPWVYHLIFAFLFLYFMVQEFIALRKIK